MKIYIHEKETWPYFTWNHEAIQQALGEVRNLQGRLIGKMEYLGFDLKAEASLNTITKDIIKTSEIEGEILDDKQVRSSIARHLRMDIGGLVPSQRNVDGIVEMVLEALQNNHQPLTQERLFTWHQSLFPLGESGNYNIEVGKWRDDLTGPMEVISGAMGKEKVHFVAPKSSLIPQEMEKFIDWFNSKTDLDEVIKAAIAHLWFLTIHPFDDGNGRIARVITDMQLARADKSVQRFYSMSTQIREERKGYYEILEKTQKGNLDITNWLMWFINCLSGALQNAEATLNRVLFKAEFWKINAKTPFNDRQILMLNKLLDGIDGKLSTSKWAKMAKCSPDSALRDITDLIQKEILIKEKSGGRSTNYELKM